MKDGKIELNDPPKDQIDQYVELNDGLIELNYPSKDQMDPISFTIANCKVLK